MVHKYSWLRTMSKPDDAEHDPRGREQFSALFAGAEIYGFTPDLRRIVIIGHQFVNAD
jgi:hypothetical protein